jgi:hypothetical protein
MSESREWHKAKLSTPSAVKVLAALAEATERVTATEVADAAGTSVTTTREVLTRAFQLGWATKHVARTEPARYSLTAAGLAHLRDVDVFDAAPDGTAISPDDQSSSAPMAVRGKPSWCTPGHGVCAHC